MRVHSLHCGIGHDHACKLECSSTLPCGYPVTSIQEARAYAAQERRAQKKLAQTRRLKQNILEDFEIVPDRGGVESPTQRAEAEQTSSLYAQMDAMLAGIADGTFTADDPGTAAAQASAQQQRELAAEERAMQARLGADASLGVPLAGDEAAYAELDAALGAEDSKAGSKKAEQATPPKLPPQQPARLSFEVDSNAQQDAGRSLYADFDAMLAEEAGGDKPSKPLSRAQFQNQKVPKPSWGPAKETTPALPQRRLIATDEASTQAPARKSSAPATRRRAKQAKPAQDREVSLERLAPAQPSWGASEASPPTLPRRKLAAERPESPSSKPVLKRRQPAEPRARSTAGAQADNTKRTEQTKSWCVHCVFFPCYVGLVHLMSVPSLLTLAVS